MNFDYNENIERGFAELANFMDEQLRVLEQLQRERDAAWFIQFVDGIGAPQEHLASPKPKSISVVVAPTAFGNCMVRAFAQTYWEEIERAEDFPGQYPHSK